MIAQMRQGILLLLIVLMTNCSRAPLKGQQNSMRKASPPPILSDDLPLEPFLSAIMTEMPIIKESYYSNFIFGDRVISKEEYLEGLQRFLDLAATVPTMDQFYQAILKEYDFYEVYGEKDWGNVMITSYFEPLIFGSKQRTDKLTQPLYAVPADMLYLDLSSFDLKYGHERKMRARVEGRRVVPYFSREEIDARKALQGKKLELCWVDPLDAFLLQIQGSGVVQFENGRTIHLNYAEKNGWRYEAIGKYLKDRIPLDQLNLMTIETHLRSLPREELQLMLNKNPSYVFFKETDASATTYLGVSATDGRTIATDARLFPKGAIGFLSTTRPKFENAGSLQAMSWEPLNRFVIDQDIGGAITGPGRVDLFWGRGEEAKHHAGAMKQQGKLYYIVPKPKVPQAPFATTRQFFPVLFSRLSKQFDFFN